MTPIEKRNYLKRIGFDVVVHSNKLTVWKNEEVFKIHEFKNPKKWQDALFYLENIYYQKYKNIESND